MKKLLLAGAALALIAGPASAQVWQNQTYADQNVTFGLSADADVFCKFNTQGGASTYTDNSGPFVPGAISNVPGSSGPQGDGNIVLDIQNNNDNTVQTAGIIVSYNKTVCNTPFQVTTRSLNGGLKAVNTTTDTDYVLNIPYDVDLYFDGTNQPKVNSANILSPTNAGGKTEAWAGTFGVGVRVEPMDKLVIEGDHNDTLYMVMVPTITS